jgi:hypothetical protein
MQQVRTSVRLNPGNLNHHIWNNNGTWWCHFTVHLPDYTKQRVRLSLGTRAIVEARRRRDEFLARPAEANDRIVRGMAVAA